MLMRVLASGLSATLAMFLRFSNERVRDLLLQQRREMRVSSLYLSTLLHCCSSALLCAALHFPLPSPLRAGSALLLNANSPTLLPLSY